VDASRRKSKGRLGFASLAVVLSILIPVLALAEEWFDAYNRGVRALRQKKWAEAAESFERSIQLRAEPGTGIVTYGTNRQDEYYPYLRLAEAYLAAGNLDKAKDALKRSEARGKEPPQNRARLAAQLDAAEKTKVVAATPPPTTLAAVSPPTPAPVAPPTTLAAIQPTPAPTPPPIQSTLAPPTTATGVLDLKSDPPGASVLLNGSRYLGATPVAPELPPGDYQVTLRKEGTRDQTFSVRVQSGKTTSLSKSLVVVTASAPPTTAEVTTPAAARLGSLLINSEPRGALVFLDDESLGATDSTTGRLVKSGVVPGRHRVRVSMAGRQDFVQEVEVGQGGLTSLQATLLQAPRTSTLSVALGSLGVLIVGGLGLFAWTRRRGRPAEGTRELSQASRPATHPSGRVRTAATPHPSGRATAVSAPTLQPVAEGETRAIPPSGSKAGVQERFGEFLLLEPLGKGGMAAVFKAERKGEICALKRPLAAFLEDPEFLERFLREAEIGRTLHHPNIIRIFDRGDVSGIPFFTMELVRGETLQAFVKRTGALGPKPATKIIAQVAEALDYAHLKGVVHRDLKPSNIMILTDGTVKVMDYGIARARRFEGLTVTGAFLGTPDYVAPETAEGKGTDARSDLYSLGIVFYEIVTGRKPFVGDTPFATLRKHCTEIPTPPSVVHPGVPRELEAIILRLLSKDPADRYPGAEELLIELRDYLNRAA